LQPIELFKKFEIINSAKQVSLIFKSSGTTGHTTSKHYVQDAKVYEKSFRLGLDHFYGDLSNTCILGLLPSYLENGDSSLVYMVDSLIKNSKVAYSDTFLHDYQGLSNTIKICQANNIPILLIGVTYALLDFADQHAMPLKNTVIIETGGMKGRRKEMIRAEVHETLSQAFGLKNIHSEYGMTELLSQAYSKTNGLFYPSPTMKVLVRDINDPFAISLTGKGALNIIDLSNIHSCSFIATMDVGEVLEDGSFYVTGRLDQSDIRGCSLLAI
jgi:hypothetical protein